MGSALGWIVQSAEEKAWSAAKDGDLCALQAACASSAAAMEWREPERGRTPFVMACSHSHAECVRWLIDNGADVYGRDYRGNTPLHYACIRGQPIIVQLLLSTTNFTPFTLNAKGFSPLDAAREAYSHATYDGEAALAGGVAACIDQLEAVRIRPVIVRVHHVAQHCLVYEAAIYTREHNTISSFIGIAALRSWSIKHAKVFRTSSSLFLELALYSPLDEGDRQHRPVPSATYLVLVDPVNRPTTFVRQAASSSWLRSSKAHGFSLLAGPTPTAGVPALDWLEFAAVDSAGLDGWSAFFVELAVTKVADPNLPPDLQFHTQTLGRPLAYANYVAPPAPHSPQPHDNDDVQDGNGVVIAQLLSLAPRSKPPTSAESESTAAVECVVCFDAPQAAVCVPCGHNVLCMDCAYTIAASTSHCPVCRQYVREVIQVYRS